MTATLTPAMLNDAQSIASIGPKLQPLRKYDYADTFRDRAVAELLSDYETFAGWLQCATSVRRPSSYFKEGAISNVEMLRLLLGTEANPEQVCAAWAELKARYLQEHAQDIAARIVELIGEEE